MAIANPKLIEALRNTIQKLENGADYQWGHMGKCNCGHLARELTEYSAAKIHEYALKIKRGAWADQEADFCPTSKMPMDILISSLLNAGLEREDLRHIEELSEPKVLATLPLGQKYFRRNMREDVVKYFTIWVEILVNEWANQVDLPADLFEETHGENSLKLSVEETV